MGVMATFLRAIGAGAIHFRHSATLLTHYGRLGPSFDLCAKVIVDILLEEGMYRDNGEAVVEVILHALREVKLSIASQKLQYTHSLAFSRSCFSLMASLVLRIIPLLLANSYRQLSSRFSRRALGFKARGPFKPQLFDVQNRWRGMHQTLLTRTCS